MKQLGHPIGVDAERFHLIAPYESDPRKWIKLDWIDQYTAKRHRITTAGHHGARQVARVKTYGEVLREYEYHPESNSEAHLDRSLRLAGEQDWLLPV